MTSKPQPLEENFLEAYENWEIERLYTELEGLSPNGKIFLRGILCGFQPTEIAKKLSYGGQDISSTVRQTLSKEVYPKIRELLQSEKPKNWRDVPQLLERYKKQASTNVKADWREICAKKLEEQQRKQQLRRKATQMGCEVQVYVPLGLVERKQQQPHPQNLSREGMNFRENEVIGRVYEHDEFLREVIRQNKDTNLGIVGEAGSGKTTWLEEIVTYIKDTTEDLYIWITLGSLQKQTLEEYILKKWLPDAVELTDLEINPATLEKEFKKRCEQGRVWLLLDGVDEVGDTSTSRKLHNIQNQLTGWLSEARVVLTCRTNVWDTNLINHPLSNFETYKTQEFKPEQVDQFIQDWFTQASNEQLGQALQAKLKEPQHEQISQLVTNPLRLALLCQIFYKNNNGELPQTKAQLYEQFIRYFYEWKSERLEIDLVTRPKLQHELHEALGRLAIAGLDSSAKYRLPESLVHREIRDNQLLKLALNLDWLVLIDRDNQTDEPIYEFYHPTFQEYFAALAVPNWEFLLKHIPGNISESTYRIFESYWQEIALMWIEIIAMKNLSILELKLRKIINSSISCIFSEENCLEYYSGKIFPFLISLGCKSYNYSWLEGFYYGLGKIIFLLIHVLVTGFYYNEEEKRYKLAPNCYNSLILNSIHKLPNDILYRFINNVDQSLKSFTNYMNYKLKILEIMLDIPSKQGLAAEKMLIFLHLNNELAIEAAQALLKHDKFFPLAIDKIIDIFLNLKDEVKCQYILDFLIENKSVNTKVINLKVLKRILSFLESKDYYVRCRTISLLDELSDFGIIDLQKNSELLDALLCTIENGKEEPMIVLAILDLLEKFKIKSEIYDEVYDEVLMYIICTDQQFIVLSKALKDLEKRDLDLNFIYEILDWMAIYETVSESYTQFLYFLKNYSLLKPEFFESIEMLKKLIILVGIKYNNNEEKNAFNTIQIVADMIENNDNLLNALKRLRNISCEDYIIKWAEIILEEVKDRKNYSAVDTEENQEEISKAIKYQEYKDFLTLLENKKIINYETWDNNVYKILHNLKNDIHRNKINIYMLNKIIDLIEDSNNHCLRMACLITLNRIGALHNLDILKRLFNLILITKDGQSRYNIVGILTEITQLEILKILVANFREYTADQVYDNDLELYLIAHDIIWHCTQHMSYPEFHYAWYSQPLLTPSATQKSLPVGHCPIAQQLNFSELPTTLQNAIANNSQVNQAIHLVYVDSAKFSNLDNPAIDIYIEMIEQNCPEREKGEPETLSQLKGYLRVNLKNLDKKVVLLFYTSEPDCPFSESFLNTLKTFGGAIALISNQTCENIQCFYPEDPHLIENIMKWIERMVLES